MTARLPFTLTPHEGQDFVAWLHAYAARLDVTPAVLAGAIGLADHAGEPRTHRRGSHLAERHVGTIAAATGLSAAAIEAMLSFVPPGTETDQVPGTSARKRDPTAVQRLREATTLPPGARLEHATSLRPRRRGTTGADPAVERAGRLPDQLWPAWAIRLADNDTFDPATFRSSMLAALLLPHSERTLGEIAGLAGDRVQRATVAFHLRKLLRVTGSAVALQILTELAFAVDTYDLPIDYARRRRLVTGAELIDRHTWARFAKKADARIGGPRRVRFARCYLYELLTGNNLHLAPSPYRMESGFERIDYHDFVASLPHRLVDVLHHHAERLLADAGITGEPLQWQPPTNWVTVTDWPGAEPDLTDPEPIHQALRSWRAPQAQVAASLGISTEHLRYVVRQHPRPRPAYPTRRVLVAPVSAHGSRRLPGPNAISLDPVWLHREYVTWRRSLPDIAAELGCSVANLKKFAHEHDIPVRRRSGPEGFAHLDAPGVHPSQVPEPLRSALVARDACLRLSRFVVLAEHPSLTQAAQALGAHQCTLTNQLQQLERACGGLLLQRHPHPRPVGPLTPLGEQLHRQALDHLQATSA